MQLLIFVVLGLVTGTLSGLFGIGGGVVIVPFLVLVYGLTQQTASAVSLVALLFPVGLLGVYEYYRTGFLSSPNIQMGLCIASGMFVGTFFGARIATQLPAETLRKIFAVFLVLIATKLWLTKS